MSSAMLARLRWLPRLAVVEWPSYAAGALALLVSMAMMLSVPQLVRVIVDEVLRAGTAARIDRPALLMLAVFAADSLAVLGRDFFFQRAAEAVMARLKQSVLDNLLRQEVAFFDGSLSAELTSRLAADAAVVQDALSVYLMNTARNLVLTAAGTALLLYTSVRLSAVAAFLVPVVALLLHRTGPRIKALSRRAQDQLAAANESADSALGGIRTVRLFSLEERFSQAYAAALRGALGLSTKRILTQVSTRSVAGFLGSAFIPLLIVYGARMVARGEMTPGALVTFVLYASAVAGAFGDLIGDLGHLLRADGAAERLLELRRREPRRPLAGGERPAEMEGHVVFEGVRFAYPARRDAAVLRGLDLAVGQGEVVALVGPSGAGKSTLVSVLTGLYGPDGGRVLIDGRELRDLDPSWLRARIAVVEQDPVLFPVSIATNIALGRPVATSEEVQAAARAANADGFIRRFPRGYDTLVGERGVQLSGGQRQRIAIARAMLKDPRILVLDEATSALDAGSESLVQEALERLMRGRTTIVIAHRLSTVVKADRIEVMDQGRIVQSGRHEDLMRGVGLYRQLVESQLVAP
jgi:ABC-type multidrug transport system fused ATPase/permease subunit